MTGTARACGSAIVSVAQLAVRWSGLVSTRPWRARCAGRCGCRCSNGPPIGRATSAVTAPDLGGGPVSPPPTRLERTDPPTNPAYHRGLRASTTRRRARRPPPRLAYCRGQTLARWSVRPFFPSPGLAGYPRLGRAGRGPMAGGASTAMNAGARGLADKCCSCGLIHARERPRCEDRSTSSPRARRRSSHRPRPGSSSTASTRALWPGSGTGRSSR